MAGVCLLQRALAKIAALHDRHAQLCSWLVAALVILQNTCRITSANLTSSEHAAVVQVTLLEARSLPVWGFPWQSNPWCRLSIGKQTVTSRRDDDTSREGSHRAPVWNQEFQLLVESPSSQV